jgi:GNAT superfamily N-acetyltransferase
MVDVEIMLVQDLPVEERDFINDWIGRVFGGIDDEYEWARGQWAVLIRRQGSIVSYVEIAQRRIEVEGHPLDVGGIANVMTLEDWRRRGFASAAMRDAITFIRDELQTGFGLLVCEAELIPYYEGLGWHVVSGPLVADQPQGKVVLPHITMVLACNDEEWPVGTIDLCGLPW